MRRLKNEKRNINNNLAYIGSMGWIRTACMDC